MARRSPAAGPAARVERWVTVGKHRVGVRRDGSRWSVESVQHPKGERGGCSFTGALRGFELFNDHESRGVKHARVPDIPDVMYQLGELGGVQYISDKWGGKSRTYVHRFTRPRPLLCGDHRGRLWIIGGRFRVTADGIEG